MVGLLQIQWTFFSSTLHPSHHIPFTILTIPICSSSFLPCPRALHPSYHTICPSSTYHTHFPLIVLAILIWPLSFLTHPFARFPSSTPHHILSYHTHMPIICLPYPFALHLLTIPICPSSAYHTHLPFICPPYPFSHHTSYHTHLPIIILTIPICLHVLAIPICQLRSWVNLVNYGLCN